MAWYKRSKKVVEETPTEKRSIPAGVFTKCPSCNEVLLTADLHKNLDVCSLCNHHFAMATRDRIASISANSRGITVFRKSDITSPSVIGARMAPVRVTMGRRIATGNARIETMTATIAKTLVRLRSLE